ncbi:MAG TPA: methyltransferase domain-containing protein [Candidatus Angelobacter sp.]|nr:methyltransferase domain-containing protein [Candidatus Angelobacter sp.]
MLLLSHAAMTASDWDGSTYHRVSGPQLGWGRKVLARLDLRGDETVIDAGCGSGRLTAELLDRLPGGRVIAVDASPSMLKVAARELERFGDRVELVHSDLLALDMDRVADVIVSTATFHWVLDHPALFARLHSALRPGGRLLAQCGGDGNLDRIRGRARRLLEAEPFAPHMAGFTPPWEYADPQTTAQRLTAAGFTEVSTGAEDALTVLDSEPAYREFLATVIMRPYLDALPDDRLRTRLLDAMSAEARTDDPPWSLDYRRLNMDARRPA